MATITSPRPDPVQRITSPSLPSVSGTPSSSVRPSLDLPRTNNPASPALQQSASPGAATAQMRNRAALRDYYNLKSKAAPAAGSPDQRDGSRTASVTSVGSDSTITSSIAVPESTASSLTAQLDDPSFNADAFVAELLKSASLRDILKTESALVSEIRTLDGERKALVYNNYSKLIKAVGTIAEMQKGMHKNERQGTPVAAFGKQRDQQSAGLDGVKEVGHKLDGLLKVMKGLRPRETEATRRIAQSREHRRQKGSVRWALGAPHRLQSLIDDNRRYEAEQLHTSVLDLLRKWDGVEGVDELQQKCAEVMNRGSEHPDGEHRSDTG
ncbi:hypothetical protein A1O7_04234 [Cladophialophora yegresii CBS 114405]|uniref:Vacuolar protein sorting-associated protein 51 homolog n=1 Tax=Cladophialophora yegresii CBS 114405 TaxID=1182544 RepID=W9WNU2_9EURO|nr:uncharacterized protein A1O7_04234 [Cladophialophora yegresii CBS 114405]EXJ60084.1 hypothetical protein A1O7_04234 [Cladophialophora yegresii CBS 114405]